MAKFLLHYKLHLVILGLGVLVLGLAIWVMLSKVAKKPEGRIYGVNTIYYKERLKRLTDGSRYGNNATVCHQALTVYYQRKTEEEAKKALQTIQTQCRLSKQSGSQTR